MELLISRWSTVVVLILCTLLAWLFMQRNIALIVWIGVGGMMAAFAGPLVLGAYGGVSPAAVPMPA